MNLDLTATAVFAALFLLVTWLGFVAAHWRKADLNRLHEWGLGGRRFGTAVTWFLLGGDLYTAYAFIALPALIFGAGAMGFFVIPYAIVIYPILYLIFPRLWIEAKRRGHVTAADYVRERFNSRLLASAVAVTGIVATMPYIAVQLIGIEVVIGALGFSTQGFVGHLPLVIAFLVLAGFTYTSGLRAPALIAVVKDVLIFVTVFAAVIIIPAQLGGYGAIFASLPQDELVLPAPAENSLGAYSAYVTLALGSGLALFLYPHALTGVLSASSDNVVRRNAALLSAYSFLVGLIALLGFTAIAAGVDRKPEFAAGFSQDGPQLRRAGVVRPVVSILVRGRRLCIDCDRCVGSGGNHAPLLVLNSSSRATSTRSSGAPTAAKPTRPAWPRSSRSSSRSAPSYSSWRYRRLTLSSFSFLAASGSSDSCLQYN